MSPAVAGTLVGGRYRLEVLVATGGMAQIWRGHDTVLSRPVAVKVLLPHLAANEDFVARFRREAVAAGRVSHPSVVQIYDTCREPEAIVMELVEGPSLRAELDERRFLPPARVVDVGIAVCNALEAAHRAGLVHRDIKPGNILLAPDGRVRVGDFGIAKAAEPAEGDGIADLTREGMLVGTAKYLAPEQVEGKGVDARTDLYSLGVVLFEMVCGRPPFEADNEMACATARLRADAPRARQVLPSVPPALDAVIARALSRDPETRWQRAADLRAALEATTRVPDRNHTVVEDSTRIDGGPVTPPPSFTKTERSWLVPALLIALVATALGVTGLLLGGTNVGDSIKDGPLGGGDPAVVLEVSAASFDPDGDGNERDDLLTLATDGDPETAWQTEGYNGELADQKPGVGLVLTTTGRHELEELVLDADAAGWNATVYVATSPADDLAGWGDPVDEVTGAKRGATTFDLDGADGGAVLVWFTDLGDEPPKTHVYVSEVTLRGT